MPARVGGFAIGEAGRLLAERLRGYADRRDVLVLGLPRGGVPVARRSPGRSGRRSTLPRPQARLPGAGAGDGGDRERGSGC